MSGQDVGPAGRELGRGRGYICRPVGSSASSMHPWLQEGSILARLPTNHHSWIAVGLGMVEPTHCGSFRPSKLICLRYFCSNGKLTDAVYFFLGLSSLI